jgi:hypothetical protein
MNINAFIAKNRIKMDATLVDSNPHMDSMPDGSTHWKCAFRAKGKRMTVFFSMGPAHSREPEAGEVLDCLASDASSIENARNFEDWAAEYGYDTDSRKAERTFKTCEAQAAKLRAFLGDGYEELLWKCERQ